MIEVQVPKDVSTYESPLIGPLTARQAVCVAAAAAVEYIYYLVISTLKLNLTMNTIVFAYSFPCLHIKSHTGNNLEASFVLIYDGFCLELYRFFCSFF